MDVSNVGIDRLIDMLESNNEEMQILAKEMIEGIFGEFKNLYHMLEYLYHVKHFKEVMPDDY